MEIRLPNGWEPRPYQRRAWGALRNGARFASLAWHRRAGKDDVCLHHSAIEAHKRVGNYWHQLPEYSQARKAIWDAVNPHTGKRRIDEAFPIPLRKYTREQEMSIGFHNGSTWQVVGSDNYDSLMGTSPAGIVLSEYALSNPSAWGYFSPIIMENKGWALFISTPRGRNHFHQIHKHAQKAPGWFHQTLTNDDTGVFSVEDLQTELERLQAMYGQVYGKSIWLQEYFCSFDAAIPGSIWGDCLDLAQLQGRIGHFPLQPEFPVNTAWDLGFTDDTSIWFYQIIGTEIHLIDYHESTGKSVAFYGDLLRTKAKNEKFRYGTHWLPHDARARTLAAGGKSIQQQLGEETIGQLAIAKRLDHEEGIQAARATFPKCCFNEIPCEKGLESLRAYHREWNDEKKTFGTAPVHDWSSHAASAFRTLSLSWRVPKNSSPQASIEDRMLAGSVGKMTFGDVKNSHFAKMREKRAQLF